MLNACFFLVFDNRLVVWHHVKMKSIFIYFFFLSFNAMDRVTFAADPLPPDAQRFMQAVAQVDNIEREIRRIKRTHRKSDRL